MQGAEIVVRATWDDEASVWIAESDDVPGLVTEAPTVEDLLAKLEVIIPELFELNGVNPPSDDEGRVPFVFVTRRATRPMTTAA